MPGMRRLRRPDSVAVWYRDIAYDLNLMKCRRALIERQVEGELSSMEGLAESIGISRSTTSRFFSGRATSLAVTLKILTKLGLKFEQVATMRESLHLHHAATSAN